MSQPFGTLDTTDRRPGGPPSNREKDAEEIAMRKLTSETGMSLVEATIILMTLAILTAVISPTIGDYVSSARNTKAKEDVEAIGTAILRVTRDTGLPCLSKDASTVTDACKVAKRADLLYSGGNTPKVSTVAYTVADGSNAAATSPVNWLGETEEAANKVTMDDQFILDSTAGYSAATVAAAGGPRPGTGWRGAYLSGPIGPDPWGAAYESNTMFLTVATNANVDNTKEGDLGSVWQADTFVISAGANGVIETKFGSAKGTTPGGDDVVYVVQGSSN
jgi:type II secretory pathway pseudopilin PulG